MRTIAVLFFLACAATAAQHGGSGGGANRSSGGTRNVGTVRASGARTSARQPKAATKNPQAATQRQTKPTAARPKAASPAATARSGIMRTTPAVAATASNGRTVVVGNYGHGNHATWSRMWWGGGWYFGGWYGPGWYYPWAVYPGYWYWNGWSGYRFEYEPRSDNSGIKFDLGQIKTKGDRKAVGEAGVYLPDENGKGGYLGSVENFLSRKLPLRPGTYDLTVALADGRQINLTVTIQPGRVTHVALRLDQPPQASAENAGWGQKLVPAPPPPAK